MRVVGGDHSFRGKELASSIIQGKGEINIDLLWPDISGGHASSSYLPRKGQRTCRCRDPSDLKTRHGRRLPRRAW